MTFLKPLEPLPKRLSQPALFVLIAFPLLKLALHLAVGRGYGYHGDELYYLVCADHLDWGYVDHPPLSILLLAVTRRVTGQSVQAIRIIPALAGAATVFVIGMMTRELKGGPFAMALAMAAALAAPFYLFMGAYYSMNALDVLCWAGASWIMLRILGGGSPRLWIALGIVLGLGLQNKISVMWLAAGLAVGLLLTPERRLLRTPGPWLAGLMALAIASPYAIWQLTRDFASVRFIIDSAETRVWESPLIYLADVARGMSPMAMLVWMAGLAFYLVLPAGRGRRALGWAWLAVMALLAFSHAAKAYYAAPTFSWLFAAGGAAFERWLTRWPGRLAMVVYGCLILLAGGAAAPVVLPILPQDAIAAYSLRTGAGRKVESRRELGSLPDFLGMMAGWDELMDGIARAYERLPEADRSNATILAPTYQIAAAIDLLGRERGLPAASSGHNNYWFWGFHGTWTRPLVVVGHSEVRLRQWFDDVSRIDEARCRYCGISRLPIYLVRGPRLPQDVLWRELRNYE